MIITMQIQKLFGFIFDFAINSSQIAYGIFLLSDQYYEQGICTIME